jgi:hypothetical protein
MLYFLLSYLALSLLVSGLVSIFLRGAARDFYADPGLIRAAARTRRELGTWLGGAAARVSTGRRGVGPAPVAGERP